MSASGTWRSNSEFALSLSLVTTSWGRRLTVGARPSAPKRTRPVRTAGDDDGCVARGACAGLLRDVWGTFCAHPRRLPTLRRTTNRAEGWRHDTRKDDR